MMLPYAASMFANGNRRVLQATNCSLTSRVRAFPPESILEGSDRLAMVGVRGISYSIGYSILDSIKTAQSSETIDQACNIRTAKVINQYGKTVPANADGAQAAVRGTNFKDTALQACAGFGLCANIWDGTEKDVYPISTLTYLVLTTINQDTECANMKIVYDYATWILFSSVANRIAQQQGFGTMPIKVAQLARNEVLDKMTCEGPDGTKRFVKDETMTSQSLIVKGAGSSLQGELQYAMLKEYTGSGNRHVLCEFPKPIFITSPGYSI